MLSLPDKHTSSPLVTRTAPALPHRGCTMNVSRVEQHTALGHLLLQPTCAHRAQHRNGCPWLPALPGPRSARCSQEEKADPLVNSPSLH